MFDIHDKVYLELIATRNSLDKNVEELISEIHTMDTIDGYSSKWAFIVELRQEQEAFRKMLTTLIEQRIKELKK